MQHPPTCDVALAALKARRDGMAMRVVTELAAFARRKSWFACCAYALRKLRAGYGLLLSDDG